MLHRRKTAAAGALLAALLAFTVFRPPSTAGPLERDFEAYYAAGATIDAGGDPYSRAIWRAEQGIPGVDPRRDELLPYVGPAAALPLWSLLARLPYRPATAIWSALLIAAIGCIAAAAVRIARAPRDLWLYALAAAVAFCAAPVLGSLALGQAALISAAAVAAAIVAYGKRRFPAAAGATLVAALQPNLALALIALIRTRWDVLCAGSAAAAFAIFTLAAGGGAAGFLGYLQLLLAHGAAERGDAIQYTPAALAYALGLSPAVAAAFGEITALGAIGAAVVVIRRERLDATTATLVAAALLPLAAPFFHEHDFVLTVLPLLVLAIRAQGRARGLAGLAAMLLLVDWFGLAQRAHAQGQILCLGLAVAAGFAGLGRSGLRFTRADLAAPLALGALSVVALPLAAAHPAPTWPDMLPAGYHADPGANAAAVWADEQRVAGLMTGRVPAWGALHSLPLAGTIVLTAALVADARRRRTGVRRAPALPAPNAIAFAATRL